MTTPLSRPALALALTACLSACASMGDTTTHGQLRDVAPLFGQHAPTRVSPATWPSERWWQAYGDAQLDALIENALTHAPTLDAADARTRRAIAVAGLSDAARQPTLGAGAQVSALQLPETLMPKALGGGSLNIAEILSLQFKWAPDLWGKERAKWQAAIGQVHASEADAHAARATLIGNIVRNYVALSQAYALQDVARADATRVAQLAVLSEQRVRAGIDNRIGLQQQQSQAAASRSQAEAAQQQIDALKNSLALLAGHGPERAGAITRPTLDAAPTAGVPLDLPSGLLARRADIVAARWRVEAATRGIAASRAAFYPSINLSAMVGLAAGNLGDLFGNKALLLNGGPALTLPIFEGGALRSQLAMSQADHDLAVANYNQTLLNAIREVSDALQAVHSLDAQIAEARLARDRAQQAWQLLEQRRRAGLANGLQVLYALKPLLQLDQQLATLQAKRRNAYADLQLALGGGVPAVALPSTSSM